MDTLAELHDRLALHGADVPGRRKVPLRNRLLELLEEEEEAAEERRFAEFGEEVSPPRLLAPPAHLHPPTFALPPPASHPHPSTYTLLTSSSTIPRLPSTLPPPASHLHPPRPGTRRGTTRGRRRGCSRR